MTVDTIDTAVIVLVLTFCKTFWKLGERSRNCPEIGTGFDQYFESTSV